MAAKRQHKPSGRTIYRPGRLRQDGPGGPGIRSAQVSHPSGRALPDPKFKVVEFVRRRGLSADELVELWGILRHCVQDGEQGRISLFTGRPVKVELRPELKEHSEVLETFGVFRQVAA